MGSSLRRDLARHQEQLDQLENGAIIVDAYGNAWQQSWGSWYRAFDADGISSFQLAQNVGRVTVLTGAPEPDGFGSTPEGDTSG